MTIFTNNKSTKFCQITLHIKNLFIKEKWFLFLPHNVQNCTSVYLSNAAAYRQLDK